MINDRQLNVLRGIVEITTIQRGPRIGKVKKRIERLGDSYDIRTLRALARRNLIDCRVDTMHGDGWAATVLGAQVANNEI